MAATPKIPANPRGTALAEICAALDAHGLAGKRRGEYEARYPCPWQSHRGGGSLPLSLEATERGSVIMFCHGQCSTPDVLAVLGLGTGALYDTPARSRPTRNQITRGWNKVKGFTYAERLLYKVLFIDRCDNASALIAPRFQPAMSQREIAAEYGLGLTTVETALPRYEAAGWITRTCNREDCGRPWPHAIRGHLPFYEPDLGGNIATAVSPQNAGSNPNEIDPEKFEVRPRKIQSNRDVSAGQSTCATEDIPEEGEGSKVRSSNSSPDLTLIQGGKNRGGRPQTPLHTQREVLRLTGLGWTQQHVADHLGIGKGAVHRAVVRHRLADDLGVTLADIGFCRECKEPALRSAGLCGRHGGAA